MKNPFLSTAITFRISLFLTLPFLLLSCNADDSDISEKCSIGSIPDNDFYKLHYVECYNDSFWIEVESNPILGKDVSIHTAAPIEHPNFPIEYQNVVEVAIPEELRDDFDLTSLLGQKIFFQYRHATEAEISDIRNTDCASVYEFYEVPVLILTAFSFSACPS